MEDGGQEIDVSGSTMVGVGCFSAIAGGAGGAMIGVLIAKIVGSVRGCEPSDGVPACYWSLYAMIGVVVGIVVLPTISILRLRGRRSA